MKLWKIIVLGSVVTSCLVLVMSSRPEEKVKASVVLVQICKEKLGLRSPRIDLVNDNGSVFSSHYECREQSKVDKLLGNIGTQKDTLLPISELNFLCGGDKMRMDYRDGVLGCLKGL